jgi:hypothetical protein
VHIVVRDTVGAFVDSEGTPEVGLGLAELGPLEEELADEADAVCDLLLETEPSKAQMKDEDKGRKE